MLTDRPDVLPGEAQALLCAFGLEGAVTPLDGERDRSFAVRCPDGKRYVLKITHPADLDAVALQDQALQTLQAAGVDRVPQVVTPLQQAPRLSGCPARVLTWIDGRKLAEVRPKSNALFGELGGLLARIDAALAGLRHPAESRPLRWDLATADTVLLPLLHLVEDPALRSAAEGAVHAVFADDRRTQLPQTLVQNDANDHNVFVAPQRGGPSRLAGLIDFGDMIRTWRVAEPAIAAAYCTFDAPDPLEAVVWVLSGYHAELPLTEAEVGLLWPLTRLRLATSVVLACAQSLERPDDPYLTISAADAQRALLRTGSVDPALAEATLRHAAGLDPSPAGSRLRSWLSTRRATQVLAGLDAHSAVIDLSVQAPDPDEPLGGVGRYGEVRSCYRGALFDAGAERRTVHLGVDLFAPAGTPVHAPAAGVVAAVANHVGAGDYGPTLVLRHEPSDGPTFHTLLAHLDPAVLRLRVGTAVCAGETVAHLGAPAHNGGWPPHLHLQLLAEPPQGAHAPGVAKPARRAVQLARFPNPVGWLGLPPEATAPPPTPIRTLAERRAKVSASNLSHQPIHMARGEGAWMVDAQGQRWLDCVNNVTHVGHANPRVAAAMARQASLLATNTRYLHEGRCSYQERLAALFPAPLEVVILVCSGSEANELALRIATAATGRAHVVAMETGYHGNTERLIGLSHYKHAGVGGKGTPPWVSLLPVPDPFGGPHRGTEAGRYAQEARDQIAALTEPPAALLVESLIGCGGQVVPPAGYLAAVFEAMREVGGVCIADEVQVGFGRVGEHWWGFEEQGVVPDIVTLGKPIGNGFPMAAVVTTHALAQAFDDGMEFFNTFGGNPVAAAVGHAVLDAIEQDGLRDNALRTGAVLAEGIRSIGHPAIGEVRGRGLFLGVELVDEHGGPAPDLAAWVVKRAREERVLISRDGPARNVLKIKPPMVFGPDEAAVLLRLLRLVFGEDALSLGGNRAL
jgi:4-aminobutyrate aminotransferase-like enzyme/Ser/Thr protein kinase RdoA (MazF antagonist)